jgi:hypothetical protein
MDILSFIYQMDAENIDLKILNEVIFKIAENNGTTLSETEQNNDLAPEIVKVYIIFLQNMGMVESPKQSAGKSAQDNPLLHLKLKPEIEILQKIINLFDNKELSRFINTKFYRENIKSYYKYITDLLTEQALFSLPETEYTMFALKNSPSCVRYFLADNDRNSLKSFYQRCISSTNEKLTDRKRLELMEKCHMYLIWENVIFNKIQDDKRDNILVEQVPYYTGYLPIAKKSFEKILELYKVLETEPSEKKSKLQSYLKSMISIHNVLFLN